VTLVGIGLIGRAWAAIFARAGWNVRLTDPQAPRLKPRPAWFATSCARWRATVLPMIPMAPPPG
jgi:3-hydroxyacyl-CoA dehydrogenase